ncbi:MAG: hypothetical protein BJ554DRAFT_5101, partial [Olpidium bornovanus]
HEADIVEKVGAVQEHLGEPRDELAGVARRGGQRRGPPAAPASPAGPEAVFPGGHAGAPQAARAELAERQRADELWGGLAPPPPPRPRGGPGRLEGRLRRLRAPGEREQGPEAGSRDNGGGAGPACRRRGPDGAGLRPPVPAHRKARRRGGHGGARGRQPPPAAGPRQAGEARKERRRREKRRRRRGRPRGSGRLAQTPGDRPGARPGDQFDRRRHPPVLRVRPRLRRRRLPGGRVRRRGRRAPLRQRSRRRRPDADRLRPPKVRKVVHPLRVDFRLCAGPVVVGPAEAAAGPREKGFRAARPGLLQRAVARLIASATRPISMSYAQIMPTADPPRSSQGVSAGLFTGSERVVDLLTGETRYETEGQNFWSRLVKAPVGSLLDVNGRLRDGRRFWSHEGHAIVSFEFADRAGHARRLVLVDAAITDVQQAASVPPFGASQQRLTSDSGAIALDKLFADARFAAKNMVLIATVSQEAGSAAETMATLVSAGEVLAGRKAKGGPRGKSAPRDREGARPSGGDAAAAPSRSLSFSGGGADADAFPDLHPLLREELEANRALTRELDGVADELAGAQRELARARLRERELMLDVSAAHGSLMALAQERDFEQAALLEAAAAAAEARAKRSSLVEERERLRRVIAGITGGWGVGPDGRLLARAAAGSDGGAAGKSVADALATFASGHAEAHAAAELLRRDLEERDRQLEKARRVLSRESRTREKLELRLGAAADDDDDDPLSPAGSAPPNRPASGTSTTSTTARALAPSPSPSPSAPPAVSAAAAASSKALPAGHLPLLTLDVAVGSSPLHLLDSRWTDEIARLDVPPRAKPDAAGAAAEWEKSAGERQDHRRAAANVLGVDLPADLASELENESEWEAMIAQFELDERRSAPTIRHRIYTADFAGSPY